MPHKRGSLFIVSAPSGTGKTTLVNALLSKLQPLYPIERSVTYTTKLPRQGEIPGKDYHYISILEFEEKIAQGFFLEWSGAYGNYYGTPKTILDTIAKGHNLILVIDRIGAQKISEHYSDAILIWLYVSDFNELKKRLIKRGTEQENEINTRLKRAQEEIYEENVNSLYNHHIENRIFEIALLELESIVFGCAGFTQDYDEKYGFEKKVEKNAQKKLTSP